MIASPAPTTPLSGGSPILAMARRAAELRAAGRDIVDLTLGEPDFAPPIHASEAAVEAARRPLGYTPANGIPALRAAARASIRRDRGLDYADDEIAVGCGAKQVIFNTFLATLKAGDEVVIPAPYWASYPDMVRLCGAVPVITPCAMEDGFRLGPAALDAAITERTRWIVLNAPGNPSGAVYDQARLRALADVLRRHPDCLIMSDEIYAYIRYTDEPYTSLAAIAPDLRHRILLVDGVSKAYAMTGWRVGWGFGSAPLITRITAIQTQNCTQTAALSQIAAVAALNGPQDVLAERNAIYRARRDAGLEILRRSDRLAVLVPDGAFYFLPRSLSDVDDATAADALLDAGVATVPGSAFGSPGHLRLSFATDLPTLEEGCRRLIAALEGRA
ncbi:pyridoxal phosphate-dependent aminotransferase [Methylobacterium sp. E-065]|uniref:pyridoxal phosphate-dependent aminotransferase n=1 Tax=Methylobacterium sp. E-065 TaxID=2836583 RepID=UPI001FBA8421|nr:pyridoxal phosphate-dependent aminotransferase [Methylobacterium sp. E-065]MCJ2021893.1 pyridoxal phosphate-dependent aminotransferase [Methylobacterium sp. E-065]